jgi:hypothetical protein
MRGPKRFATAAAVLCALAIAGPTAVASAAIPMPAGVPTPALPSMAPDPNLCLSGVVDPGPFGPMGPYGPRGPYGPDGPLHNAANPIGNAATCGGLLTYVLRGGTLDSFVNANLASVGR